MSSDELADGDDRYELARRALARAQDTARNKGFRPGIRNRRTRHHPSVVPGAGRDPAEVTDTVDRLISMMGWRKPLTVSSVLGRWADIVGAEVAAHSVPERFVDGELTVRADSTAWASQLRYLRPQIERRLEEEVGEEIVTKIHIFGPQTNRAKGRWTVPGRGPRDTYG